MHEFDARLVYLDRHAAAQLLGLGEAVHGLEFRLAKPNEVNQVERQVFNAIGRSPYRTLDWRALNNGIFTALKLQKVVMFFGPHLHCGRGRFQHRFDFVYGSG